MAWYTVFWQVTKLRLPDVLHHMQQADIMGDYVN